MLIDANVTWFLIGKAVRPVTWTQYGRVRNKNKSADMCRNGGCVNC